MEEYGTFITRLGKCTIRVVDTPEWLPKGVLLIAHMDHPNDGRSCEVHLDVDEVGELIGVLQDFYGPTRQS